MRVKDVMTRKIVSLLPQASVADAVELMVRSNVSGLPVIKEDGTLVGIVTEGDLLRRSEIGTQKPPARWYECFFHAGRMAEAYAHTHGRRIDEIMSSAVVSIDENSRLADAVALMEKHGVKRLPVVRDGRVVGIVSRADFVRALAVFIRQPYEEPPVSDARIKAAIEAELKAQPWAPVATIGVAVNNGVVELSGVITDEVQRNAIRIVAENVQGVRQVTDHLAWVEPISGMVYVPPDNADDDRTTRPAEAKEQAA